MATGPILVRFLFPSGEMERLRQTLVLDLDRHWCPRCLTKWSSTRGARREQTLASVRLMSADVLTGGVLMTGTDILSKGDDGLRTDALGCTGEVVGGATVCAGPILSSVSVSA